MLKELIAGAIKPVTDLVANRQERKRQESEARATLDRIMAEAAANDSAVAGQIALVNAQNQNNTWKDEFALITVALPVWIAMILGGFTDQGPETVHKMFEAMNSIPESWQQTFQVAIWSALGITGIKKVFK